MNQDVIAGGNHMLDWLQVRRAAASAAASLAALSIGCATDKCATIPPGAIPQPVGTFACQWQTAQAERAEEDDFVFYNYEWHLCGTQLGPYGHGHLAHVAERMLGEPAMVTVAPAYMDQGCLNEELNTARWNVIVQYLTQHGVLDAASRVRVGPPQAEGMYGPDAAALGAKRLYGGVGSGGGASGYGGGNFGGGGGGGGFGGGGGGFNSGGIF
jgi:uncharacterized membrane protein YgcG